MITLSKLDVGELIGDGGQGDVYALADRTDQVLKRYKPDQPCNPDGLRALADWRARLQLRDRAVIDRCTAWPAEVVDGEDGTYGLLMPRAPHAFWHTVEGESKPRDLSWAFMTDAARFVGLQPAAPPAAVEIVHQLAVVLEVLHRNGAVYGDLSATNVLWSGGSRPGILLIDCDAAEVVGCPRALPDAQSPLWECPWPRVTGQERDDYKLALAFLRVVFRYEGPVSGSTRLIQVPATPPVTREAADLLRAGLRQASIRPTAGEWIEPLRALGHGLRRRRAA